MHSQRGRWEREGLSFKTKKPPEGGFFCSLIERFTDQSPPQSLAPDYLVHH